ncbi:hypothetical protein F1559_000928 [Cyanidiococcus yangmingshanensis]|uniref:Uncharacterized protein n=1 Tax=Cyanidiococcus yangmingshanensis TaxID=2690220 RepID=A0A7J7ID97_9RHOD|nr:hypothetical protein F1559_000928 [Cyanidiococcus yangmingshanensis]
MCNHTNVTPTHSLNILVHSTPKQRSYPTSGFARIQWPLRNRKFFQIYVFKSCLQKEGREKALAYASQLIRDTAGPLTLSEALARVAYTFEKYFKRLRRSETELREIEALLRRPASEGFPQAQYLLGLTYQELAACRERAREIGSLPDLRELASPAMRVSNLQCFVEPVNAEPERVIDIVKRERCIQSAHDGASKEACNQDEPRVLYEESFGLLRSAVEAGMVEARTALAAYYMYGIHPVPEDATRALDMLMESAKEGDSNAHVRVACYFRNMTPPNLPKALHHFKLAAGMGDMHAEHEMGCIYIMGELGQEIDYARGIKLLEKAAEKGHPDSHFILARIFCGDLLYEVYDGPIFTSNEKFCAHISTAVEAEHAGAIQFLAESIYRGNYKLERDYPRALRLLFDAAQLHAQEQNMKASGECLYTAGLMIYHGLGIQKDSKHAFFVMQAAHEFGNIPATRFLSDMYAMGDGVVKNEKMAKFLAQIAELRPNEHLIRKESSATFDELPSKKLA